MTMINKNNALRATKGVFFKCATPTTPPDIVRKDGTMYWVGDTAVIRKSSNWGEVEEHEGLCLFEFKGFSLSKTRTGIASYAELTPRGFSPHAWKKDTSSEMLEYLVHQAIEIDWNHYGDRKPLPMYDIAQALRHQNSSRKVLELALRCDRLKENIGVVKAIVDHPMVKHDEKVKYLKLLGLSC